MNDIREFEQELLMALLQSGLATSQSMRGCSEVEIKELETRFGVKLPAAYQVFLKLIGHQAGDFSSGTDCSYSDLLEIDMKGALKSALMESRVDFELSETTFVFSSHQSCIFHFFDALDDPFDPPVFGYCESDDQVKSFQLSFSEFVLNGVLEQSGGTSQI